MAAQKNVFKSRLKIPSAGTGSSSLGHLSSDVRRCCVLGLAQVLIPVGSIFRDALACPNSAAFTSSECREAVAGCIAVEATWRSIKYGQLGILV